MSHTPFPILPPEAAITGVALRPRTGADDAFLRDLYISTRWEELAGTGWPEAAKNAFLDQQFAFQTRHYEEHYPGAAWAVVTCAGARAGRLLLQVSADDLRVIDVALLPAHRGRGIGATLIRAVQAQASGLGAATVSLHVERDSRVLDLYRRLGFAVTESRGLHSFMVWPVPPGGLDGSAQEKAAS